MSGEGDGSFGDLRVSSLTLTGAFGGDDLVLRGARDVAAAAGGGGGLPAYTNMVLDTVSAAPANGTPLFVSFEEVAYFVGAGFTWTIGDPTKLYVAADGVYSITATWTPGATHPAVGLREVVIITSSDLSGNTQNGPVFYPTDTAPVAMAHTITARLSAGDHIQVVLEQTSGEDFTGDVVDLTAFRVV